MFIINLYFKVPLLFTEKSDNMFTPGDISCKSLTSFELILVQSVQIRANDGKRVKANVVS